MFRPRRLSWSRFFTAVIAAFVTEQTSRGGVVATERLLTALDIGKQRALIALRALGGLSSIIDTESGCTRLDDSPRSLAMIDFRAEGFEQVSTASPLGSISPSSPKTICCSRGIDPVSAAASGSVRSSVSASASGAVADCVSLMIGLENRGCGLDKAD